MDYLTLTNRFWDFNQRNQIGSTAISMYLYLLKVGCDNNIYDFRISDVKVSRELGLTRKTVKSTKEKLNHFGLIKFQTSNGLPCYYKLLLDYPLQIAECEKVEKMKMKKGSVSPKLEDLDLPSRLQSSITLVNNLKIPSFEEFIQYARTLEFYVKELELSIKEKYEAWISDGWQNSSGRPITNWKSSLKGILPYIKNMDNNEQLSIKNIPVIKHPENLDRKLS